MAAQMDSKNLHVAGQARPVHLHIPLRGDRTFSSRGHAQTTYSGNRTGFLCWPDNRLSYGSIDRQSRDCLLEVDLCGIPLRIATRILEVIPRLHPLLVLDMRNYVYLEQKRQSFRAPLQATVVCWWINGQGEVKQPKIVTQSVNISKEGILLWTRSEWPRSQQVLMEVFLRQDQRPIRCGGEVVRTEQDGSHYLTALEWRGLSFENEERIISYCFAIHREEISRLKRSRLTGPQS